VPDQIKPLRILLTNANALLVVANDEFQGSRQVAFSLRWRFKFVAFVLRSPVGPPCLFFEPKGFISGNTLDSLSRPEEPA
jgi:hypothetical protein